MEISLARARQAFEDIEFHPAILRDVSTVSTGWEVLGAPVAWPIGIAPSTTAPEHTLASRFHGGWRETVSHWRFSVCSADRAGQR
jgi:isopentenyl diphosphate isomerase/L-lactate dehydrogenase-like FMN-dependent dehydrogenase